MKQNRHLINILAAGALTLTAPLPALAAEPGDAGKAFVDAPQSVFPLLERSTRLDMIDYYNSNLATASKNNLDGQSRITAMSPKQLDLEMTGSSTASLVIMPGTQGLIGIITTVATPAADSRIDFYTPEWEHLTTENYFKRPELADWLTAEGKQNMGDVEAFVPFVLMSYSINPDSGELTVTNNTSAFLPQEISEMVEGYLKPSLTYTWNGKKFQLKK